MKIVHPFTQNVKVYHITGNIILLPVIRRRTHGYINTRIRDMIMVTKFGHQLVRIFDPELRLKINTVKETDIIDATVRASNFHAPDSLQVRYILISFKIL